MVGALASANDGEQMCSLFIRIFTAAAPAPASDPEAKAHLQLLEDNRIFLGDSADKRREKAERIKAWWDENGARYHQSWRVWSSKCSDSR